MNRVKARYRPSTNVDRFASFRSEVECAGICGKYGASECFGFYFDPSSQQCQLAALPLLSDGGDSKLVHVRTCRDPTREAIYDSNEDFHDWLLFRYL